MSRRICASRERSSTSTTWVGKTIANLYKSRWQIELFFKWIKQHLKVKRFVGRTKNAVLSQLWVATSEIPSFFHMK